MPDIAPVYNPLGDFGKKLEDRIREDIKELLPEDALQELIKKAVQDTFFKPRKVPKYPDKTYSSESIHAPSWFITCVTEAAEPLLRKYVQEWVEEQSDEIEQTIRSILEEHSVMLIVTRLMTDKISAGLDNIWMEIQNVNMNMHNR